MFRVNLNERKCEFLTELFKYNKNNYMQLKRASSEEELDINVFKAATSLITRYFIWIQNHPELPESEIHSMFYVLSLDELLEGIAAFPAIPTDKIRSIISRLFLECGNLPD